VALVRTKIITKQGTDVPVDYRMLKKSDRWFVYDVVIEGVSLINNYRNQFNKIIQTSSYEALVDRMKNKQNELLEDDKGKKS
jgi:phospholipid transport system substrate-binding protein